MTLIEQVALIDKRFLQLRLRRAHMFAQRNAAAIARLQARGLADPTLGPFGTTHHERHGEPNGKPRVRLRP
jgi:hypothetical protein